MLAVFGFFCTCFIMLFPTVIWLVAFWDCSGPYSIGGSPNTWNGKLGVFIGFLVLAFAWWLVFQQAPFEIKLNVR